MYTDNITVKEYMENMYETINPTWISDASPEQIKASEELLAKLSDLISQGLTDCEHHWEYMDRISRDEPKLLREHRLTLFKLHLERKQSLKK